MYNGLCKYSSQHAYLWGGASHVTFFAPIASGLEKIQSLQHANIDASLMTERTLDCKIVMKHQGFSLRWTIPTDEQQSHKVQEWKEKKIIIYWTDLVLCKLDFTFLKKMVIHLFRSLLSLLSYTCSKIFLRSSMHHGKNVQLVHMKATSSSSVFPL